MKPLRRIFIDLDGPLLNTRERHYYCHKTIVKKLGLECLAENQYWIKKRAKVNVDAIIGQHNKSEIYQEYNRLWRKYIETPKALSFDTVQNGAPSCLHAWKNAGINITGKQ